MTHYKPTPACAAAVFRAAQAYRGATHEPTCTVLASDLATILEELHEARGAGSVQGQASSGDGPAADLRKRITGVLYEVCANALAPRGPYLDEAVQAGASKLETALRATTASPAAASDEIPEKPHESDLNRMGEEPANSGEAR